MTQPPATPAPEPITVSPAVAAELLGISLWSVHKLIKDQSIPSGKVGGRRIIKMADLRDYVDRITTTGASA